MKSAIQNDNAFMCNLPSFEISPLPSCTSPSSLRCHMSYGDKHNVRGVSVTMGLGEAITSVPRSVAPGETPDEPEFLSMVDFKLPLRKISTEEVVSGEMSRWRVQFVKFPLRVAKDVELVGAANIPG